jgi:hypothetical protein
VLVRLLRGNWELASKKVLAAFRRLHGNQHKTNLGWLRLWARHGEERYESIELEPCLENLASCISHSNHYYFESWHSQASCCANATTRSLSITPSCTTRLNWMLHLTGSSPRMSSPTRSLSQAHIFLANGDPPHIP